MTDSTSILQGLEASVETKEDALVRFKQRLQGRYVMGEVNGFTIAGTVGIVMESGGYPKRIIAVIALEGGGSRVISELDALKPIHAAGIFFFNPQTQKVLAFAHNHDETKLGMPGGKLEKGETAIQAARRETDEEMKLNNINIDNSEPILIIAEDVDSYFAAYTSYIHEEVETQALTSDAGHAVWVDIPTFLSSSRFPIYYAELLRRIGILDKEKEA